MVANLRELYARVIDKKAFIELLSKEFGVSYGSVKSNWLSSWLIPEQHQARVHQLLINRISCEMRKNESLINKSKKNGKN